MRAIKSSAGLTRRRAILNMFIGISADNNDGVYCDQAEQVGFEIRHSLGNIVVNQATIKHLKQIKTLATLLPAIKVSGNTIHVDPKVLFQRLIMLIASAEDLTDYLDYKLTPELTSFFKDGLMRKPNKSQIGRELVKNSEVLSENTSYVFDGGALLHRVFLNLPVTYSNIMEQYCTYILRKYGNHVHIVFDGYKSSIKDHEHQRRAKTFASIVFKLRNEVNCKQSDFLPNNNNKTALIKALALKLTSKGHVVVEHEGDADRTIAMKGIEVARERKSRAAVADVTDILAMLVHM